MSGKPMNGRVIKRPNSGCRVKFKQGPKSWRRRFLGEMQRTNNPLAAIKAARITWECYQDWIQTGFLSEEMLNDAYAVFKRHHPTKDIVVKHTDQELEDSGLGVAPVEIVEAVGYDERSILKQDGWINSPDWTDDYEW